MPLFVSTEGYGVLFDCCSLMTFNDEGRESYLFLDTVDQIDYYFMGGNTMDGIIHAYRYLTGKAQMLPKWAYGYIQSKEQYYTSKELEEIVRHYREIGVPLDCVVQDWNTWDPATGGRRFWISPVMGITRSAWSGFMRCMPTAWSLYGRI